MFIMILMNPETTVGIAKAGTRSFKATIPQAIALYLELENGNKLEWKMEAIKGERVAIVRKVKVKN